MQKGHEKSTKQLEKEHGTAKEPSRETRTIGAAAVADEHCSQDRSVIGPYCVDMPDPRD
jgi:hypothetical protein